MVSGGSMGDASAIGSAFSTSLRLFQIVYEFKAVSEQTRDFLDSTNYVSSTLESAQVMRQQKSSFLSADERTWIDNVLNDSKRCLENVATMIEPARVDLQSKSGHVGFRNRSRFVFKDSPKIATNLAILNLAHQSLIAVLGVLCSKGSHGPPIGYQQNRLHKTKTGDVNQQESMPPAVDKGDQSFPSKGTFRTDSVLDIHHYEQSRPLLLSDDREELSCSSRRCDTFVAELEGSEHRLTMDFEQRFAQQAGVLDDSTTSSETTPVNGCIGSEGPQLMKNNDPRYDMSRQYWAQEDPKRGVGLEQVLMPPEEPPEFGARQQIMSNKFQTPAKTNGYGSEITATKNFTAAYPYSMMARSKGRAWLQSRALQW